MPFAASCAQSFSHPSGFTCPKSSGMKRCPAFGWLHATQTMHSSVICNFLIIISLVEVLYAILQGAFWISY